MIKSTIKKAIQSAITFSRKDAIALSHISRDSNIRHVDFDIRNLDADCLAQFLRLLLLDNASDSLLNDRLTLVVVTLALKLLEVGLDLTLGMIKRVTIYKARINNSVEMIEFMLERASSEAAPNGRLLLTLHIV